FAYDLGKEKDFGSRQGAARAPTDCGKTRGRRERQVVARTTSNEKPFRIWISAGCDRAYHRIDLQSTQAFAPAFWLRENLPLHVRLRLYLNKSHEAPTRRS